MAVVLKARHSLVGRSLVPVVLRLKAEGIDAEAIFWQEEEAV